MLPGGKNLIQFQYSREPKGSSTPDLLDIFSAPKTFKHQWILNRMASIQPPLGDHVR